MLHSLRLDPVTLVQEEEEIVKAVVCIQRAWRRHLIRKCVHEEQTKRNMAALVLQAHFQRFTQKSIEVTSWLCADPENGFHRRIFTEVMTLLKGCNHSEAHLEVAFSALGLIMNLARIPTVTKDDSLWWNTNLPTNLCSRPYITKSSSLGDLAISIIDGARDSREQPHKGVGGLGTIHGKKLSLISYLVELFKSLHKRKPGTVVSTFIHALKRLQGHRLFVRICCLLSRFVEANRTAIDKWEPIHATVLKILSDMGKRERRPTESDKLVRMFDGAKVYQIAAAKYLTSVKFQSRKEALRRILA
ncbi:hypothetical protein Ciccas_004470 [Cichlidogyrus casuarinus]|uniref:Uncharacterized protein n=1 Tax=Cichlidogyrus casuarinus TaxID=1844966 RepID=A0ABD2QBF1_9PLAT